MKFGLVDPQWQEIDKNEYFDCLVNSIANAQMFIENTINSCPPSTNRYCYRGIASMLTPHAKIISDVKSYITKYYALKNGRPEDSFLKSLYSPKFNLCRPLVVNSSGNAQGMVCHNHALAAWQESKGSITHNCSKDDLTANCRVRAAGIRLEYIWTDMPHSPKFHDMCDDLGKCSFYDFLKN
jgi:hypothetical protein